MFKPLISVLGHPGMEWPPVDHDHSYKLLSVRWVAEDKELEYDLG